MVLLDGWRDGSSRSQTALIAKLYPELSRIAAARLRQERDVSLSTGDLINEAVVKLMRITNADIADRAHFIALSSRIMRHILVDHIRSKNAVHRRHKRVDLNTRVDGEQRLDLVALESALMRLGVIDPELMEIIEMRFFGGMTIADIGDVTGWSQATVKRRWQVARAWLADALVNPVDDI